MKGFKKLMLPVLIVALALASLIVSGLGNTSTVQAKASKTTTCHLNSPAGNIQHVIYVQFDNVHLTRDNPNVPSDLEQMPHLLNFIKNNGTMLSNNHTPLIAHTGNDILSSITGLYGDRHGVPVSNSYLYFNANGTTSYGSTFGYWTAPVSATNPTYNMLTAPNTNTPAPWVAYTRAGCNFGAVGTANTILENNANDVNTFFGSNSPEAAEAKSNPGQATSDFVGIGIHCAQGAALCSSTNNGRPDLLPSEPGGYHNYLALMGHKYVAPQISPNQPLTDLDGNVIKDGKGHIGFPGFDGMSASVSLAYVAAMQEHNVPVTYTYISDAHDAHGTTTSEAYGPGQKEYVAALKSYDDAFAKFFTRLQKDGITAKNSLFVFAADENDHLVSGAPTPANCDGIHTYCTYNKIGEVNTNLTGLLATEQSVTTPFTVHSDSSPTIYITSHPQPQDNITRTFEHALGNLTAQNPYTNQTEQITNYLADPVEMKLLHMVTADPSRTPTATLFAKPDYFLYSGNANCQTACVAINPAYAWNHGDVSPDINRTWLGLVGPGVRNLGINSSIWADHTDIRPTMLELLGLKDDYTHDGRVLIEALKDSALPQEIRSHRAYYEHLGQLYKQLDASVGELGLNTLKISTIALESNTPGDTTYTNLENTLTGINTLRDAIGGHIIAQLEWAEFGGSTHHGPYSLTQTDKQALTTQGEQLLNKVATLAQ